MAVALRGAAAVDPSTTTTTSLSITVDPNVVADDLLFLTVTSRDSTSGSSDVTVTDNDTGGNAWAAVTNTADKKAWIFWKRATSGTASKTVTVSNCVGSATGVLKAFSGGDTGATPYADIATESNAAADETHAGFTPSQADSMLCTAVFNYQDNISITVGPTFATAGATAATQHRSTGGSDCGNNFGHVVQTGGPTATGDLTWSQNDFATYSTVWTIKPLAAGAPDTYSGRGIGRGIGRGVMR